MTETARNTLGFQARRTWQESSSRHPHRHYKIKKGWNDLPTDDELKAKTFEAIGGATYAKLKTHAAQTNEKATQSAEMLRQQRQMKRSGYLVAPMLRDGITHLTAIKSSAER